MCVDATCLTTDDVAALVFVSVPDVQEEVGGGGREAWRGRL